MFKEYGSEYWADETEEELNAVRLDSPRKPLFGPGEVLVNSGRSALFSLLHFEPDLPDTVLLPAYTCETVIYPFVRCGKKLMFYDILEDFSPDISNIEEITGSQKVILVHMGFFGPDTNKSLAGIIPRLMSSGSVVVEDITHTLFNGNRDDLPSNYRIGSIRKWLGIPSGGVLIPQNPDETTIKSPEGNNFFADLRLEALRRKAKYMAGGESEEEKAIYRTLFSRAEGELDALKEPVPIDEASLKILHTTDFALLREKRRRNFEYLLKYFPETENARPIFGGLPEGCCPLFFPIYVKGNNRALQEKLARRNLYCPIHWPKSMYVGDGYRGAEYIYSHELSIPCDQRYGEEDMGVILALLREALR